METLIGQVLPYCAVIVFVVGALYRIGNWMRAPKKLNWKLYPVPQGIVGEARYILEEWTSFKTLFRNNRPVWLGSYVFHVALVALVLWFMLFLFGLSVPWLVSLGAVAMMGSSVYLFAVRLWVPQMRVLSSVVEFFNLALFIGIGWALVSLTGEGYGQEARTYFIGLLSLRASAPPESGAFIVLLLLAEFFLAYLPFSKMFHMASKYFAYHKGRWFNPYQIAH